MAENYLARTGARHLLRCVLGPLGGGRLRRVTNAILPLHGIVVEVVKEHFLSTLDGTGREDGDLVLSVYHEHACLAVRVVRIMVDEADRVAEIRRVHLLLVVEI